MKIFWSWQSDTPGNIGRHFVREAIARSLSELSQELKIEESERPELDHDRKGVSGSPDLAATIPRKIDESDVFIADVTPIGNRSLAGAGALINSNVAIELGYALAKVGDNKVLMVMNEYYGSRADLPFDLRHKAGPIIYKLDEAATGQNTKRVQAELTRDFKLALRDYIRPTRTSLEEHQEIPSSFSIAQYFPTGEVLAERERKEKLYLRYGHSVLVYLRLIPTHRIPLLRNTEIKDLVFGIKLRPLNSETPNGAHWGLNRFGGITYDFEQEQKEPLLITSSQLFPNRELWGIDTTTVNQNESLIYSKSFERVLTLGVRHFVEIATERLNVACPVIIEAGMSNVQNFKIATIGSRVWGPIHKQNITVRHKLTARDENNILQALGVIFEEFYDATAHRRPESFGPIGKL